jgi:hypothetical protein
VTAFWAKLDAAADARTEKTKTFFIWVYLQLYYFRTLKILLLFDLRWGGLLLGTNVWFP